MPALHIAHLLEDAARLVKNGEEDRAAWRVADAGGLLRQRLEDSGRQGDLAGVTQATGNGFRLPEHEERGS